MIDLSDDNEADEPEQEVIKKIQYDWRYENSINNGKERLIVKQQPFSYEPYRTNAVLANHADTVLYANEMNIWYNLPVQAQYDYLFYTIRKQKRFAKKSSSKKSVDQKDIALVQRFYKYNYPRAKEALKILSNEQLDYLRQEEQEMDET